MITFSFEATNESCNLGVPLNPRLTVATIASKICVQRWACRCRIWVCWAQYPKCCGPAPEYTKQWTSEQECQRVHVLGRSTPVCRGVRVDSAPPHQAAVTQQSAYSTALPVLWKRNPHRQGHTQKTDLHVLHFFPSLLYGFFTKIYRFCFFLMFFYFCERDRVHVG